MSFSYSLERQEILMPARNFPLDPDLSLFPMDLFFFPWPGIFHFSGKVIPVEEVVGNTP